eukprot:CAMPEP_0198651876 /NCGR_PEP_ID=MMETSP1467-20131203/5993_1 /TAXON_ID=1462469 /ORGANISM="unid. sp., Strain CCMP2135" /LENGTH=40 /DNA_ID= /DNA_START= /DNA_END= /DNA_ORIENTATION=
MAVIEECRDQPVLGDWLLVELEVVGEKAEGEQLRNLAEGP